jgi:hypothetical protein
MVGARNPDEASNSLNPATLQRLTSKIPEVIGECFLRHDTVSIHSQITDHHSLGAFPEANRDQFALISE